MNTFEESNDRPVEPAAPVAPSGNRKERRTKLAQGRKLRKRFGQYKAHMASHGYDATFEDFVESMP